MQMSTILCCWGQVCEYLNWVTLAFYIGIKKYKIKKQHLSPEIFEAKNNKSVSSKLFVVCWRASLNGVMMVTLVKTRGNIPHSSCTGKYDSVFTGTNTTAAIITAEKKHGTLGGEADHHQALCLAVCKYDYYSFEGESSLSGNHVFFLFSTSGWCKFFWELCNMKCEFICIRN